VRAVTVRAAALAAVGVLLVACGGPTMTFSKPGVSDQQRKLDQTACTERSLGPSEAAKPAIMPEIDRDAVVRCMQAKGYVLHDR
jgi:hypothetical protein